MKIPVSSLKDFLRHFSVKRLLMLFLCCAVLVGFAMAVSSPMLTDEARTAHLAEAPADDEYAFLFD